MPCDVSPAFYRTTDSIKNFKVKVNVNKLTTSIKIPKFNVGSEEEKDKDESSEFVEKDFEEITLCWQQKLLSEHEVKFYGITTNLRSRQDQKYHEEAQYLSHFGRTSNLVFTYINTDDQSVLFDHPKYYSGMTLLTEEQELTALARRNQDNTKHKFQMKSFQLQPIDQLAFKQHPVEFEPNNDFKKKRSKMSPCMRMLIMLEVPESERDEIAGKTEGIGSEVLADGATANSSNNAGNTKPNVVVKTEPLMSGEEGWTPNFIPPKHHVLLCTIKLYSSGVLMIKPDFNAGETPYTVSVPNSSTSYEFTLTHESNQPSAQDKEARKKLYDELYQRHFLMQQSKLDPNFELPPIGVLRVLIYGEFLFAKNFSVESMFVSYCFDLPPFWEVSPESESIGTTHRATPKYVHNVPLCFYSHPFEFECAYHYPSAVENDDLAVPCPLLYLHCMSIDDWGRMRTEGYGYLPMSMRPGKQEAEVHTWRPRGSLVDELRNEFVGGTPELDDLSYVAIPSARQQQGDNGTPFSKYGFKVDSAGSVVLRYNIVIQNQAWWSGDTSATGLFGRERLKHLVKKIRTGQTSAAKTNIFAVIDAFSRGKDRLTSAQTELDKAMAKQNLDS